MYLISRDRYRCPLICRIAKSRDATSFELNTCTTPQRPTSHNYIIHHKSYTTKPTHIRSLPDKIFINFSSNQLIKMSASIFCRAIPRSARAFSTSTARSSFAKMTIVGRLADTPEVQATSTGQEILKYAVGTNYGPKDNQKTSWFRVVSFMPDGPQRNFISGLEKG
ncbi:hypothetical protein F5884DRAFT_773003 [Xylogone sp. PMI_703]|nr:hypothetical protein F5884DRAFT_773003 [Xylogone sp. PMI_703]